MRAERGAAGADSGPRQGRRAFHARRLGSRRFHRSGAPGQPRAASGVPACPAFFMEQRRCPDRYRPKSTDPAMPTRRTSLFARPTPIVAVVHAGPSPGVPGSADVRASVDRVVAEARTLVALGVDGLLVENAHDQPAVAEAEIGHEVVAYLTRVAAAVKRHAGRVPVGVRVVAGLGARRARRRPRGRLRLRAGLGLGHGPGGGGPLPPLRPPDRGRDAVRLRRPPAGRRRGDGRARRGRPGRPARRPRRARPDGRADAAPGVVEAAAAAAGLPVFCGGGVHAGNVAAMVGVADGFFVGSGLKEHGRWQAPVCEARVHALIGARRVRPRPGGAAVAPRRVAVRIHRAGPDPARPALRRTRTPLPRLAWSPTTPRPRPSA